MTIENLEEPTFSISTVSRLTEIPVDTLRVWERRYNAVTPYRSEDNKRRYTQNDINRLRLIKELVVRGHAVSSVAKLSQEVLQERLRIYAELQQVVKLHQAEPEKKSKVLIYGDDLPFLVNQWSETLSSLEIIGAYTNYVDFERDALTKRPDVLLTQCSSLQESWAVRIWELFHRTAVRQHVVVYSYAPTAVLSQLRQQGILTVRAPVTADILEEACRLSGHHRPEVMTATIALQEEDAIPPRRFNAETLAAITPNANRVRCECPRHLVDLVLRLSAFEVYSTECENLNLEDAVLHAKLHHMAGKARALIEDALAQWIQSEDLQLPGG
jgi:DNA-binding transcriptional MerR regulator